KFEDHAFKSWKIDRRFDLLKRHDVPLCTADHNGLLYQLTRRRTDRFTGGSFESSKHTPCAVASPLRSEIANASERGAGARKGSNGTRSVPTTLEATAPVGSVHLRGGSR